MRDCLPIDKDISSKINGFPLINWCIS